MKRAQIFNDCKSFVMKQMYAKNIKPERAKEIVLKVKETVKSAKTEEATATYIKNLSSLIPEFASLQLKFEQKEHAHFDELVGSVAEMLLDQGKFDEMIALTDWYEAENPDDEKITIYIRYHFPEIANTLL